jgi:hypothetical protein
MKLQPGLIHGDIGTGTGWLTYSADATYSWSQNNWYHIAYVVNSTSYNIYVNGNLVGSGTYNTATPLLYDSTHNLKIGWSGYTGEYFIGIIDEVMIYDRALSATEVTTLYTTT